MEHHSGWKPLPVILKVIWIILLIGVVFSVPAVFSARTSGYPIFGLNVFGYWAAVLMFLVNLLLPVWLIIAMLKRYSWTWIYAVAFYLFIIINELMGIGALDQFVQVVLSELPEMYFDMIPDIQPLVWYSALAGIIMGALVDVFFMLMFIIKRKYFMQKQGSGTDLQSGGTD